MSKYAIFGDSFITRLQSFTNGKLDFDRPHRFFGVSEMSTQSKFTSKFREMLEYQPRYVFINLGGNDITAACDIQSIYINLINIAEELYNSGVERVFVASIIERGNFEQRTGLNSMMFNKIRRSLNNKLKKYFGHDFVQVGKRLRYPRHYDMDLVHPGCSEKGMTVFKHEVLKCFRRTIR
ncbi:uncharacterized protein LOC132749623 [Ruditapes philippinarum]|uniref:uncharacterized protein LOC132749623 n=1 Tax=Ruditapes philippinarum TaxID=129788 RepID=UPI00295BACCF|nr:uncharacterized protein LOC132749623 [Ruditapes philippinarum]